MDDEVTIKKGIFRKLVGNEHYVNIQLFLTFF